MPIRPAELVYNSCKEMDLLFCFVLFFLLKYTDLLHNLWRNRKNIHQDSSSLYKETIQNILLLFLHQKHLGYSIEIALVRCLTIDGVISLSTYKMFQCKKKIKLKIIYLEPIFSIHSYRY